MKALQINVLTPKGQSQRTMDRQLESLIGFGKKKDIIQKKVISDHEFMIQIKYKDDNEFTKIHKKLFRAEAVIKEFYKSVYKMIKRVNRIIKIGNKLGKAGKKGLKYVYSRVAKMLTKEIPDPNQRKEMQENLKLEEIKIEKGLFKEIKITDREEMDKLLSGDIIKTKEIKI